MTKTKMIHVSKIVVI